MRVHRSQSAFHIPVPDLTGFDLPPRSASSSAASHGGVPDGAFDLDRVSPRQLSRWLTDKGSCDFDEVVVVDARFWYEFKGGHISGARNIVSRGALVDLYKEFLGRNVCFVFHCEFSKNRGPRLKDMFRDYDRRHNTYPNLSFPHVYVLDGGFRRFFEELSDLCEGTYVPMLEGDHEELKRCQRRYSREMRGSYSACERRKTAEVTLRPLEMFADIDCGFYSDDTDGFSLVQHLY